MASASLYSSSEHSFPPSVRLFILHLTPLPSLLLAVAARFGIGGDFWLNLVLTLAGYIPGLSIFSSYLLYLPTCSPQATCTTSTFKISATIRIIAVLQSGLSVTVSSTPKPSNVRNVAHSGQTAMKNAWRGLPTRTKLWRTVRIKEHQASSRPPTL